MIETIVALAVMTLVAYSKSTTREVCANQGRSSRSRNGQMVVRHQNESNRKEQPELW